MIISISGDAKKPQVQPDPANVQAGEHVSWQICLDPVENVDIECEIYFNSGHPFASRVEGAKTGPWMLRQVNQELADAGSADEAGDYKYGVRTITSTGLQLSDDDPHLIVR